MLTCLFSSTIQELVIDFSPFTFARTGPFETFWVNKSIFIKISFLYWQNLFFDKSEFEYEVH